MITYRDSLMSVRPRKLAKYLIITLSFMVIYTIISSVGIYVVYMGAYYENFNELQLAGIQDIIASPMEISTRLIVLLVMMPFIGSSIILPVVVAALLESRRFQDEATFIAQNQSCINDVVNE